MRVFHAFGEVPDSFSLHPRGRGQRNYRLVYRWRFVLCSVLVSLSFIHFIIFAFKACLILINICRVIPCSSGNSYFFYS